MSRKYFDVLVRTPGGLKWKPVHDCITHAEAKEQGESQYAGEILQTRYNGIKNEDNERSTYSDSDAIFGIIVIVVGAGLVVAFFPFIVVGGISYLIYKFFKNRNSNK